MILVNRKVFLNQTSSLKSCLIYLSWLGCVSNACRYFRKCVLVNPHLLHLKRYEWTLLFSIHFMKSSSEGRYMLTFGPIEYSLVLLNRCYLKVAT